MPLQVLTMNGLQNTVLGQQRYRVKSILIAVNIFYIIATTLLTIKCFSSHNLDEFYDTVAYVFYDLMDTVKNIVVSLCVAFYGGVLRSRLIRFGQTTQDIPARKDSRTSFSRSTFDRILSTFSPMIQNNNNQNFVTETENMSPRGSSFHQNFVTENIRKISLALRKLSVFISISCVCFLCRVIIVVIYLLEYHFKRSTHVASNNSNNYAFFVWFFKDFLFLILPIIAFFYCMGKKMNSQHPTLSNRISGFGTGRAEKERQGSSMDLDDTTAILSNSATHTISAHNLKQLSSTSETFHNNSVMANNTTKLLTSKSSGNSSNLSSYEINTASALLNLETSLLSESLQENEDSF